MIFSRAIKKFIAILSASLFALLVSVGADRLLGLIKYRTQKPDGIIFTPNSEALYEAADFSFKAQINSLGFRDREFNLAKSANHRVLAIGDSYTYGWGVNVEDAWPKVLEANLKQQGMDVEVADLGAPGAGPVKYADVAEKAIPLLRPDLVVVGVLQGDDLEQLKPEQPTTARLVPAQRVRRFITRVAKMLYPNCLHFVDDLRTNAGTNRITAEWKEEANSILAKFDADEMRRYQSIDPDIRSVFESGRLNPPLIQSAIKRPNYWLDTFDPSRPEVQNLISEMAIQLGRIRRVANEYHANVVVVSIPMGIYVDHDIFEIRRKYGFTLDRRMLISDAEDVEIRMAANKAGLPFFAVTDQFRKNPDAHFFFKLDTHFNSRGHHFYADLLGPAIENELKHPEERWLHQATYAGL
jgi:lysophospholipase L1-like esterase